MSCDFRELLSMIKVQGQIGRIKSVLPVGEYSYDIDVINSRLQASLDVVVEADNIINEIQNCHSEEKLRTWSENSKMDGVKGQKVTITKTQKTMGHEKFEKTQTSPSKNACTYKPAKTDLTETATDRDVTDTFVTLNYVEENKPMKENFVLTEEDESSFLRLYDMFPDIDPVYLTEIMFREKVDIQDVVDELSVTGYPTLRDRLHTEQRDRRRKILLSNTFTEANLNEMLLIYNNDPKGYFFDVDRVVSESYKKHSTILLVAEFPSEESDVVSIFSKNNFHYYPTRVEFLRKWGNGTAVNFLLETSLWKLKWPDEIDERFFREVQFTKFEDKIEEKLLSRRAHRLYKMKHAIENELLLECPNCLENECLEMDMVFCDLCQHSFCQDCVKRHAEIQLGCSQRVACMDTMCESFFGIATLSHIISPQLVDLYWRREIETEAYLTSEHGSDFEECPFCTFKAVNNDENDKIFKCFNPSCLRESCRKCKTENHIPLPCPTVETNETMIHNFIANQMAKAMIRVCPNTKCGNRIVKESGCNEMTCPCGQKMCYICKQSIQSASDHFGSQTNLNGCVQFSTLFEVNQGEALRAGHEALKTFYQSKDQNPGIVTALIDDDDDDDDD